MRGVESAGMMCGMGEPACSTLATSRQVLVLGVGVGIGLGLGLGST